MDGERFIIRGCGQPDVRAVVACSRRTFARHTHEDYGIGVMTGGAHRSRSGRGIVEAEAGDLITVNPGEVHDGAPIGVWRAWTMLYFDPAAIRALADDVSEGAPGDLEFQSPVIRDRQRAWAFARAYRAFTAGNGVQAEEHTLRLLSGLFGAPRSAPSPGGPGVARARARIDDAPDAPLSLATLAGEAGLSRWQLIRGFVRLTGLTPHAYLVQRRIDAARALIAGGTALADAAAASGFADQSHFTRAFVRRFGMTPGAWAAAAR
jgi:AraC-like DNA-binding protein